MKVFEIRWEERDERSLKHGSTHVVSETITKAIAEFQKEHHAERVIVSVYGNGRDSEVIVSSI